MTKLESNYNNRQEEQRLDWIEKQVQLNKRFTDVNNSSYVQRPKKTNFIAVAVTIGIIFIILLVIASIYDEDITRVLSSWALPKPDKNITISGNDSITNYLGRLYSTSIYANVVELIGALPLMLALIASMAVIFWNAFRIKNKGGRITLQVVTVLISFGYIFYRGFAAFIPHLMVSIQGVQGYNEYYGSHKGTCIAIFICCSLVLCGAIIPAFYVSFRKIKAETLSQMLRWTMATVLTILVSTILFEFVLKNIFVRERFRFIYAFENVDSVTYNGATMTGAEFSNKYFGGYQPWYALASNRIDKSVKFMYNDAIRSFPSGHTCSAAVGLLCLFMLPLTVKACNTYKTKMCIWTICPILWIAVAIGRMVAGAHYLSDTLFGSLLAIAFLIIFYMVVTWSCRFFDKWTNLQIYPYLQWEVKKQQQKLLKKN